MTKEKLFEYAVGLMRADIAAGALDRLANSDDYIWDKTVVFFQALERAWRDVNGEADDVDVPGDAGTYN